MEMTKWNIQVAIPSVSDILYLISKAIEEGWANNNKEDILKLSKELLEI